MRRAAIRTINHTKSLKYAPRKFTSHGKGKKDDSILTAPTHHEPTQPNTQLSANKRPGSLIEKHWTTEHVFPSDRTMPETNHS